jgi:hypothetical protein
MPGIVDRWQQIKNDYNQSQLSTEKRSLRVHQGTNMSTENLLAENYLTENTSVKIEVVIEKNDFQLDIEAEEFDASGVFIYITPTTAQWKINIAGGRGSSTHDITTYKSNLLRTGPATLILTQHSRDNRRLTLKVVQNEQVIIDEVRDGSLRPTYEELTVLPIVAGPRNQDVTITSITATRV